MDSGWWYRNIVEPGKLPLLLALVSFVVAFAVTRVVTRMIRAGKGPFRNVTPGGMHVHHVVPGIILMVVGGFLLLAGARHGVGSGIAAVLFGAGTGLVLDEFALVLYLSDVYWTQEGTKSVEAVMITVALALLLLCGFAPFGVDGLSDADVQGRANVVATVVGNLLMSVLALLKGKARIAVIGVLVPFVALVGAVRLARPVSWWARRLYRERPRARARAWTRAYHHDRRWNGLRRRINYFIGGRPTPVPALPPKQDP
ncbi:hypothetical protein GT204_10045 [Streptomyces sp. SID4919]|uniref:hypothetical protein n=1 Tax=unclassified Streptomyces TaxID=2593676 RepID=UPI000823F20A|nr:MULTISPECIES: hypothetical protein [unclassified Streptomyces]MYY09239.1 hypothetical protein [Streptomyces sp. SID4919]SCK42040.1 hypothetical protein YW7DRAFT_03641 [Streptomyces sp. AmelKG-E11A]